MIFGQCCDERFAVGFVAKSGLTLRSKPLWDMNAEEVLAALFVAGVAEQEAEADAEAGLVSDAVARLHRLRVAIFYALHEMHVPVEATNAALECAVQIHWPG
jgi:hypothetical protein